MQSTPNPQQADPHDVFVIEPDASLAARADKAPLDLLYDVLSDHSQPRHANSERLDIKPSDVRLSNPAPADSELRIAPDFSAGSEASPIPDGNGIQLGETEISAHRPAAGKFARRVVMGLFALGSAICAAAWQHYGDDAKAMLAQVTPSFTLASLATPEKPVAAVQAPAPAVTDQAMTQPAPATQANATTPAVAATLASDPSQQLQSLTRDLAAMGAQINELKATIAELKASQAQAAREPAKTTEARLTEPKVSEPKVSEPLVRPRIVMPPAHAAVAPIRKPKQVFPYAPIAPASSQAAAAPVPQTAAAPAPVAPQPQTAEDGGPVVRPPLPLH
jgi:TolA-binding protein